MTMQTRLQPQPTDTAVARLAGRIVAAVQAAAMLTPCVSLGAYRRLEARHDRAVSTIGAKVAEIDALRREASRIREVAMEMTDRFIRGVSFAPVPDCIEVERRDNPLTHSIGHRIRVEFPHIFLEYRIPIEEMERLNGDEERAEIIRQHMRHAARKMAESHTERLEKEIYKHALRRAGLQAVN